MNQQESIFAEAHRLENKGEAFAIAIITDAIGSVPRNSGRMLIRTDGSSMGTVGGGAMEALVLEEAAEALREGTSRSVRRRLTPREEGSAHENEKDGCRLEFIPRGEGPVGMECGGTMEVRIDVAAAPPRLLLVGGGHVNLAIARAAASLGFAVEVAESRSEFCNPERFPMARKLYREDKLIDALNQTQPDQNTWAIIATHNDDALALRMLIDKGCAYLGMLGSKRKVAGALVSLRSEGVAESDIDAFRAPVGLDIGAQTPEEIAVSVMGEILKVRSGRSGLPLQGMSKDLAVIRGGGDLATGVAVKLRRCGFPVVILETAEPTVVRRTVAFASALHDGETTVEGLCAHRVNSLTAVYDVLESGSIPVFADPEGQSLSTLKPAVLVDSILAKKNLGTHRNMAPAVVALGPGFEAGKDCDAVIETARGHNLGRVILSGSAAPNTGVPGKVAGKGKERVLRAPAAGRFEPKASLGDIVKKDQVLACIAVSDGSEAEMRAPFGGKIRGLLRGGMEVSAGFKVGDIDPRGGDVDEYAISDKARAVAGGVLEAVLYLRNERLKR